MFLFLIGGGCRISGGAIDGADCILSVCARVKFTELTAIGPVCFKSKLKLDMLDQLNLLFRLCTL